eukprot:gene9993-biopygen21279
MVATVAYRRACAGRVCRGKGGRKHVFKSGKTYPTAESNGNVKGISREPALVSRQRRSATHAPVAQGKTKADADQTRAARLNSQKRTRTERGSDAGTAVSPREMHCPTRVLVGLWIVVASFISCMSVFEPFNPPQPGGTTRRFWVPQSSVRRNVPPRGRGSSAPVPPLRALAPQPTYSDNHGKHGLTRMNTPQGPVLGSNSGPMISARPRCSSVVASKLARLPHSFPPAAAGAPQKKRAGEARRNGRRPHPRAAVRSWLSGKRGVHDTFAPLPKGDRPWRGRQLRQGCACTPPTTTTVAGFLSADSQDAA